MRRGAAGVVRVAAVAALLGGCTVGPDYQRPQAEVSAAYKEAADWKPAEPRDDASRGNWWEVFADPQLDGLIAQVDVSNQNVLAAEARYRQARAVAAASARPFTRPWMRTPRSCAAAPRRACSAAPLRGASSPIARRA